MDGEKKLSEMDEFPSTYILPIIHADTYDIHRLEWVPKDAMPWDTIQMTRNSETGLLCPVTGCFTMKDTLRKVVFPHLCQLPDGEWAPLTKELGMKYNLWF